MRSPWSYIPALPGAVGMVAGILLAKAGLTLVAAAVCLVLFGILFLTRRHYASFFALFTAIGAFAGHVSADRQLPAAAAGLQDVYMAKVIGSTSGEASTTYILDIRSDSMAVIRHPVRCCLTVFTTTKPIAAGSQIKVKCALSPLDSVPDVPYSSGYTDYLRSLDVSCTAAVPPSMISAVSAPSGVQSVVNDVRDSLYDAIVTSPVDASTSGFMLAVLLGERQFLPQTTKAQYRSAGISHLLAISGLHVGIIAAMIAFVLLPCNVSRHGYIPRCIITIITVWLYAAVTGMTPSVHRAAVMISVFMLVRLFQRGHSAYNSLLLSVIIILLITPSSLFAPGFQLSVCAVLSILVFAGAIPRSLMRHRRLYSMILMVVVPVAAMIGTGMLSAYYFHVFPGMFLLANIVTGLLFPVVVVAGVLCMALTLCGFHPTLLGWITDHTLGLMQWAVCLISDGNRGMVSGIFFSAWALLPYAAAVTALALALYRRRWYWGVTCVAMLILTHLVAAVATEKIPSAEIYIPRHSSSSPVIAQSGGRAWLISADDSIPAYTLTRYTRTYDTYLQSRGCDSFSIAPDTIISQDFSKKGNILSIGDRHIVLIRDTVHPGIVTHIDLAIVGKGFHGSIQEIADACSPSTILFTSGVHPSRRKRLQRECQSLGIPSSNLRHTPVAITVTR